MSLRDQLLAKGLVSKKRAKQIDRELKSARKQKQSSRKKKKVLEREARALEDEQRAAVSEQRRRSRQAARAANEEAQRITQIRSLILSNRVSGRGPVPYFHRTVQQGRLAKMQVSPQIAWKLRAGEAAIVALRRGQLGEDVEYFVVHAPAARKLLELSPGHVMTFVQDTTGISGPDERFLEKDWEPSLVPHRKRA